MSKADVRRSRKKATKASKIGLPSVVDPLRRKRALELVEPELRMAPAPWRAAHIDDYLNPGIFEEVDQLIGGNGAVADRDQPN